MVVRCGPDGASWLVVSVVSVVGGRRVECGRLYLVRVAEVRSKQCGVGCAQGQGEYKNSLIMW